ncbi:MAG: murein biosynthesis integral membrane protein MurJ [Spirochaetaceae bacterium]|jgi:putative peptidoglycan lipid II flippase|nr:murein biosynthesis integral membrane protein MurJ [Spirochaetaceae bacterium]
MALRRSLLRSGSLLSGFTLISRILGLVREMTKAALLGTSALSDAFSVAFLVPNLFRRLFAEGSIAVAFIPTFKEYLIHDDYQETREFLSSFWTFLSFVVSSAVVLGIVCAPLIVPHFGISAQEETALLTRIMFPYLFFISIAAFFQGILNSVHSFVPSALAPILLNIATIAAAWLLTPLFDNPARAMATGIFAGGLLEALIQFPFVLKRGFSFRWINLKKAFLNPGTQKVLRLIGPTIIGMAAYQLNDIVSTALAGKAGVGVVSSLQYSLRLQELILGVFAVSIGTVLLPQLAEEAKTANWNVYNKRLGDAIAIIALITLPVTFFSLEHSETLIRLLFQTRKFDEESVMLTVRAFTFHIAGLFFIALNRILAPAFYAQNDSLSPTIAGIVSFAVNIVLAVVLVRVMAGSGIALALSAAGAVNTVLLFFFLKKNPEITVSGIVCNSLGYSVKILIFSLLAMIPVRLLTPRLFHFFSVHTDSRLLHLVLPCIASALIFAAAGIILLLLTKDRFVKMIFRIR